MALKFKTEALKKQLDTAKQIEEQQQEHAPIVDPIIDQVDTIIQDLDRPPILQKIDQIEALLSRESLPVATLKSACRTVMLSLKENPESTLDLEPEDISKIIAGYKAIASKETMAILDKDKKTKPKKPRISKEAKEIMQMAKEGATDKDLLDLDFL